MELGKKIKALGLAGIMALSGVAIEELSLNTNEADNKVRQGILSEWMGVSRARAEDVESLEEFVEGETKEEETEEVKEELKKKATKPASERYPEIGFTDEVNQYFIDTMTEIFSSRKFYVYEREMLTAEGNPVKVRVIGRKDSFVEGYGDEELTLLGEYIFKPDDPIFYFADANIKKGYIFSFNDLSLKIDPQNNPFDSSVGVPYYQNLIYTENSFSQEQKFSVFSQIESGDLVLNLGYVGEPEIVNDSSLDQGQIK